MNIDKYHFPDDYLYDKHHFWSKVEDGIVVMGMTEYATSLAGDLVFVQVIDPGKAVSQDKPFMSVESGKWVGRVYAPISGKVISFNEELEFEPTLINKDPYGEGWIAKIQPSNLDGEINNLLTTENLGDWLTAEIERQKKLQEKKGF